MSATIIASPFSGLTVVGATAIRVLTVPTTPTGLVFGVWLSAPSGNSGLIYIAFSQAACVAGTGIAATYNTNGFQLVNGVQPYFIPKSMISNLSNLWAVASAASQNLYWFGQ